MGLLDKLFGGDTNNNGVSAQINKEVESIQSQHNESEKELMLRQEAGQEIEKWCVSESRQKGLPYDCFFEWEVKMVEEANNAPDTLKGTLRLLTCAQNYFFDNEKLEANDPLVYFNKQHGLMWVDRLCDRAEKGSSYAQSAIAGNYFVIERNPDIANRINELDNMK